MLAVKLLRLLDQVLQRLQSQYYMSHNALHKVMSMFLVMLLLFRVFALEVNASCVQLLARPIY